MEITKEEQAAINALKIVAKRWPSSLWLYSASGTIHVMRYKNDKPAETESGGIDPDYSIATIDIDNDGGDW